MIKLLVPFAFVVCIGFLTGQKAVAGLLPPTPPPPSELQSSNHSPNAPADDNVSSSKQRGIDQVFGGAPVSAGGPVCDTGCGKFSFFTEFNYLDIDDNRLLGYSGEAQGFMIGGDWVCPNELVASLAYGYDFRDQDLNRGGGAGFDLDTHIISSLLLKRSQRWDCIAFGLAGAFATSDATAYNLPAGTLNGVDTESYILNPFIAASKELGAIQLRGQVGYNHSWSFDDVGKIVASLRGSYDLTECLAITGQVGWHNITNDQGRNFILGQDNDWAEVGAGLVLFPKRCQNFYGEWTHTTANSDFSNHRFQFGSNFSF